jgi:hypothetical protein
MPRTKYFELTDQKFGKLAVQKRADFTKKGAVVWECLCECGEKTFVISANLRNGTTNSCGCIRKEMSSKKFRTHGLTKTPTYRIWSGMKTRCTNKKSTNYELYGGRGIKICERWMRFENFLKDMGDRPIGLTLDRIDVNGDYEPNNCQWATKKEQAANRRKMRMINKEAFLKFLQTQKFLSEKQKKQLADNFFNNISEDT